MHKSGKPGIMLICICLFVVNINNQVNAFIGDRIDVMKKDFAHAKMFTTQCTPFIAAPNSGLLDSTDLPNGGLARITLPSYANATIVNLKYDIGEA